MKSALKLTQIGSVLLLFVAVALTFTACSDEQIDTVQPKMTGDSDHQSGIHLDFTKPERVEEVVDTISNTGARIITLQGTFNAGDMKITDFYTIPDHNMRAGEILRDYEESRRWFLKDMQIAQSHLNLTQNVTSGIYITGVTIQGTRQESEILIDKLGVSRIEMENPLVGELNLAPPKPLGEQQNVPELSTWVPTVGNVFVSPSFKHGERHVMQLMVWQDTSGFNEMSTYEHDFLLNNNDGKTYLDSSETLDRFPRTTYTASSLPEPYLDTRFFDDKEEMVFVIGCAKANDIKEQTWYFSYIRTKDGDTNTDTAKLNAQLGHRLSNWCVYPFYTWCIYPDQTTPIIKAWEMEVPGVESWVTNLE